MLRLAIVATHPIQYYAPLFQTLTARGRVQVRVFYGWRGGAELELDRGFGREVQWDIPLLDGYEYTFVPNESRRPGPYHFGGIWSSQLIPGITQWEPEAVLVYGWNFRSHLKVLRHFHGRVPVLFRGDSTLLGEKPGGKIVLRRVFLRWVYRHVDVALFVGVHNRAYFAAHGLNPSQLVWAPHSIENERFADAAGNYDREAAEWRASLSIPIHAKVILFAGKLEHNKAPEVLLRAFLQRGRIDEHLLIVGSGVLEPKLRLRAAGNPRIHFLGFQNQSRMPVVYRLGDVYVLPSRSETWGLAVNEAMASCRPAIVSDRVGCAPDLVHNDQTGAVFRSEDDSGLADALSSVLDAPGASKRMGTSARKLIDGWSLSEQAARIETAVAELCQPANQLIRSGLR